MKSNLTTLCYIEKDNKYLMLHRISKKNDINKDKWIGVGGHFEKGESPEECLLREVKEETGLTLTSYRFRGIVTFCIEMEAAQEVKDASLTEKRSDDTAVEELVEYMCLFTADGFTGSLKECDEGKLEWVDKDRLHELELWEGDCLFLDYLRRDFPFFSLKLCYRKNGLLFAAVLDGKEIKLPRHI